MELRHLHALVAVEREGTISAAAQALGTTQPALSRAIRQLEAELGQELFTRSRNRVRFNETGRLALKHAREVIAAERRMTDAFDELSRRQRTLRVVSVAPAPTWHLARLVSERMPGALLETDLVPEAEARSALLNSEADLAIVLARPSLPVMECVPLLTEDLNIAVPAGHPLAGRGMVSFSDVDGYPLIVLEAIGFWMDVVRRELPASQVIVQKDALVFEQLLASTDLACFTTNLSTPSPSREGREKIPIVDAAAHATYFLCARSDARADALQVIAEARESAE